jgi:osmotically-inducible protein OsmY
MINTLNKIKTDAEIKNDVLSELSYEPSVKAIDIGVLVKDGTVTLDGYATSYIEKWVIVDAVKRVIGVKAIADEIEVHIPDADRRTDEDIAAAATHLIGWSTIIPSGTLKVIVREGWVSLEGEVQRWYQQNAAINLVQQMVGVKGVSNNISVHQMADATEASDGISVEPKAVKIVVEEDINLALKRSSIIDVDKIQVESSGNRVVLRGDVRSFAARDEAERIAWSEPGVSSVDNHLGVNWSAITE